MVKQRIIASEAAVINSLFASEFTRMSKSAGNFDTKTEGPTPSDAQAFKDHAEMISVLEGVLAEDAKAGWKENDEILD